MTTNREVQKKLGPKDENNVQNRTQISENTIVDQ